MSEKTFPLTIVVIKHCIRCVYINSYRIVGGKPYVSEGKDYKEFEFTLEDLRSSFPDLEIKEKVME